MKFITAEQFIAIDIKAKESILEWWKPSVGDLVEGKEGTITVIKDSFDIECANRARKYGSFVAPLLTVGQLIEFIEWKTDSTVDIARDYDNKGKEITIVLCYAKRFKSLNEEEMVRMEFKLECNEKGHNLLIALWEVAQKVCE